VVKENRVLVTALRVVVTVVVDVTTGSVVVDVLTVDVTVDVGGVVVVVRGLVVVVVVVVKAVVDVTIVEVDSAETITGSCVIVTTAKNPTPGGLT